MDDRTCIMRIVKSWELCNSAQRCGVEAFVLSYPLSTSMHIVYSLLRGGAGLLRAVPLALCRFRLLAIVWTWASHPAF